MTDITLNTTDQQLKDLQHAVNEARAGSETIRVDKEALRRLLLDHHKLYGLASRRGHVINTEAA